MTSSFGDSAEWGGGEESEVEEGDGGGSLPREINLGGGMKLVVSPDAFRTIMHTPEITAQVQIRCQEITDVANSMAVIPGAEYIYYVSNNPNNIRARGRVKPGNAEAHIDDKMNSTLLKALASVGSDPLPANYGTWSGTDSIEDQGGESGGGDRGITIGDIVEDIE